MGFFRLERQHACGLIPLKASIFTQGGGCRVGDGVLIGYLFIVFLAGLGRTKIHHFVRMGVRQQNILVRMRFFLATVGFGLLCVLFWTLAASFGPIDQQIWAGFLHQGVCGHRLRVAYRGHSHFREAGS